MDVHGSTVHGTDFQNKIAPFLIIFRAVLSKHFIVISLQSHKSIVLSSITMSTINSIASSDKDSSDCESMNTAMQIAIAQGDIMMSTTQGNVSRNTDNAPPPDVVEVAPPPPPPPLSARRGTAFDPETFSKLTMADVVLGDQPIYRYDMSKKHAMSRLISIGPYPILDIKVDFLRPWAGKYDIKGKKPKGDLVQAIIDNKENKGYKPKPAPSAAPTLTTAGFFNKIRMVNAMVDPSVDNLLDWKKSKTAAEMTEKQPIGEKCLQQVKSLYNDKEKCNEPVKEFSWKSAKHDAGEFFASLDFTLSKHLTTVHDVHAKMNALTMEYNQAYQKWKGKTKRSGQHDDTAKVPFEDMYFNTPWLVYCHSVAEKHPILAQTTRREFPPGVGVCSTDPRTAVKPPPQKKAKKAAPTEAIAIDEELVESSKDVAKQVAALLEETKKKNLREQKDNLAKQVKEREAEVRDILEKKGKTGRSAYKSYKEKAVKKLASKAAAETSDDGIALTQNSVKTDTTEFSVIKDLFSKENEKQQVERELEELIKK
ncbi:hypothetical protein FisN_24Hu066 [Fistulifera solaris]|uniref:Uncharacterized protein n=1 Tax=Fistulifera solaris TaxID=1519565 RepID=A0A1Z5JFG1_FISSO|nr:hypothetical protein FisN_24Hu066 [Fistulifera solaris]|eukprot:GAX12491.1 hypothetical protein FisN_24Hu066 [Fistulifera solaris]